MMSVLSSTNVLVETPSFPMPKIFGHQCCVELLLHVERHGLESGVQARANNVPHDAGDQIHVGTADHWSLLQSSPQEACVLLLIAGLSGCQALQQRASFWGRCLQIHEGLK